MESKLLKNLIVELTSKPSKNKQAKAKKKSTFESPEYILYLDFLTLSLESKLLKNLIVELTSKPANN